MNKKEIENLIYDYHWKRKEVDRLQRAMYGTIISMRNWGVAQYGIEATLPHGSKGKSQAELEDMDLREERQYRRLNRYQKDVLVVEMIAERVKDPIQQVIMDCMMDGMSFRAIAAHLGYSRNKLRDVKNDMMDQIDQKCHFVHDFRKEKVSC